MENNHAQNNPAPQTPPPPVYATGAPQKSIWDSGEGRKSSALATMLSLMPGLGQVYVGYYQEGFLNIAVIASLITMLADDMGSLAPLVAFFMVFYWLYNMVDAGRRASFYNSVLTHQEQARTEFVALPDDRSALLAGIALVFFGTSFLMHTAFDFSLEWLENWWPLGLVMLGVFLIAKSINEYRKA